MFKKLISQAATSSNEPIDTIMGPNTHFKGTLTYEGSVRIDGKFDGKIETNGSLVIGEGATVKADVIAGRAVVSGHLHGNIEASESVEVLPTGRIFGDILTPELQLSRGVTLEGNCVINRRADGSVSLNISDASKGAVSSVKKA